MKNLTLLLSIVVLTFFLSCTNQSKKASGKVVANMGHLKSGKYCYKALFEKDSASLSFTITANGEIKGQLNINYDNRDTVAPGHEPTAGNFSGAFRGDTLFADYYFTSGSNKDARYVNPIALLHQGDTLIMGHGKIYYYLGRTYFDDKTPISFEKSRFQFVPSADCK